MNLLASLLLAMFYSTDFSGFAPENPISEGGKWTNTVPSTWTAPVYTLTTPFRAVGDGVSLNDSVAMLTEAWGPDHTVSGRCYINGVTSAEEIELHLRMTMANGPDSIHSYEIDIVLSPTPGLVIARWNGPHGDATVLLSTSFTSPADNDLFSASISGPASAALIIVTLNGAEIGRITDTAGYATGSPGIGLDNSGSSVAGWRTYTATDGATLDARAIGSNAWHPGRSPGLGGISSARFQTNWWPYTYVAPAAFDPALMSAMEKHGNDPLVLPPRVVASGMTPPEEMPT